MTEHAQDDPWWVYPVMALILGGIIGGMVAAFILDSAWPLLFSVISFCILYAG